MKGWLVVAASFILIFAFASVDSSISPMVREIHLYYNVPLEKALWLISSSSIGIVMGVFLGPALTESFKVFKLIAFGVAGIAISLAAFLMSRDFYLSLFFRFVFGISTGLVAATMWWITYYGVSEKHYSAMVAVLMSARPLAIAIGVPFAGLVAAKADWRIPFWLFAILVVVGGAFLLLLSVFNDDKKQKITIKKIFNEYANAFRVPYSWPYYVGFTLNRMCYFGFYSLAGIWFIKNYNLSLEKISSALLFVGLGEALINFITPKLLRLFGHKFLFMASILLSAIVFYSFIGGNLPLKQSIALIALFVCLDRIYCMAAIITIPYMFPTAGNRTTFGSLNTLTAWLGLTFISWFEGEFIQTLGINAIQYILLACFIIGSAMLCYVQYKTVFTDKEGIIKRIAGIEEARKMRGVIEVEAYKKAGDEVLVAPKIFQAHGHFIASAPTFEELDAIVKNVGKMISIDVESD
jgi:predicted MFS family arabinose efflux permease